MNGLGSFSQNLQLIDQMLLKGKADKIMSRGSPSSVRRKMTFGLELLVMSVVKGTCLSLEKSFNLFNTLQNIIFFFVI